MERYIAVDNVCAWPNLTKMPDGAIVATIFNQPTHGGWEGDVECWASEDGGRMWNLRGVPAAHEPGTNRMNVAAGLARDGSLIVIASGWTKRNKPGDYSNPHKGEVLPAWICRATDGGKTWTRGGGIPVPEGRAHFLVPFGDVVQLTDGTLGVSLYGEVEGEGRVANLYVSDDDGLSWSLRGAIARGNHNETTLVTLSDGALLAAVRTADPADVEMYRSRDDGASWEALGSASLKNQHPAHLLELSDGRLLITLGARNEGIRGVLARVSDDGGESWGWPRLVVDMRTTHDVGYPSSVELDDGSIVTAYYSGGIPEHNRYHMGVARWTVED